MDLTAMKKPPRHHISGYGVTDQHLDLLQQAREAYEKAVQEYEKTKANVKRSSGKLAKKIRENDLLLRRKIDRVILLFNEINPDFFRAYMTSRKPAEEKAPPADKSAGPAAKKPATAAKKPAASTKKPATAAKKPAASTKKPATAAKKPATAAKKPSSSSGNRSVAAGEKTVKKQPDAGNS
jgi:hypothetical protein